MAVYAQVKRIPGKASEVTILSAPPAGWDDSEEAELEWLARGAGELARKSRENFNKHQAELCRRKLLSEMRQATK